jgi:hypothetical protein
MAKHLAFEWGQADVDVVVDEQAMKAYEKHRVPNNFAATLNPFGDLGCFDSWELMDVASPMMLHCHQLHDFDANRMSIQLNCHKLVLFLIATHIFFLNIKINKNGHQDHKI